MSANSLVLRPDRALAGTWSVVGAVVVALAVWIALDLGSAWLGWGFVVLCLVPALWVAAQAVAASHFAVRLDEQGIDVRLPWQRERFDWDQVVQARVVRVVGEDVLELLVRVEVATRVPTAAPTRAMGVVLPIGTDLAALHTQLQRHLGLAGSPPAA